MDANRLRRDVLEGGKRLARRLPKNVKTRIKGVVAGVASPNANQNALEESRRQTAEKEREISRLRARLAKADDSRHEIKPENFIWMLGHSRTGSTWLLSLMGNVGGYASWPEPLIGDLFGRHYYRDHARHHGRDSFVMADAYREVWTRSVRSFILDGAEARFSARKDAKYIVVKEPNGSYGAPIIMEAVPESRMVFLIRDPRDVVSSLLDGKKKDGWQANLGRSNPIAEKDPDRFVRQLARGYLSRIQTVREAFDRHESPKTIVRYEDLRTDTVGTLKNLYSNLDLPVDEEESGRIVEKLTWENIPEEEKGEGKIKRKASPGGWREDLTKEQTRIVEEETAPVIREFYP